MTMLDGYEFRSVIDKVSASCDIYSCVRLSGEQCSKCSRRDQVWAADKACTSAKRESLWNTEWKMDSRERLLHIASCLILRHSCENRLSYHEHDDRMKPAALFCTGLSKFVRWARWGCHITKLDSKEDGIIEVYSWSLVPLSANCSRNFRSGRFV